MAVPSRQPAIADTEGDWTDFVHTGPGTLAGRYMRMFWQPVYLADLAHNLPPPAWEQLPALQPGRAKPIRIMGVDFTLYRGESGAPHLVAFRCAHRGTQLSTGWVEGDDLRCFYHGWKYAPEGQCIEQPAEPEPFCQKIRIRSYPVQEYLGLIFAYLGEGEPPPLPRYPDFEEEGILETRARPRACNYFNDLDNDPAHGAFVHRRGQPRQIPAVSGEESDWGMAVYQSYRGGKIRVSHNGMPNIHLVKTPPHGTEGGWTDTLHWKVPIDDEHEVMFGVTLVRLTGDAARRYQERHAQRLTSEGPDPAELSQAILAGKMRVEDTFEMPGIINPTTVEDDVAQVGQGVVADREHERLGGSDVTVVLHRKLWERELRALAEGRPLKQWIRDPERTVVMDEAGPTWQEVVEDKGVRPTWEQVSSWHGK